MNTIWMVRITVAPYTDRNNIQKYWYRVVADEQFTAAFLVLDEIRQEFKQYRLKHLEVTVDHQPLTLPYGIMDRGEGGE